MVGGTVLAAVVAYTVLLGLLGRSSMRRGARAEEFVTGGRRLSVGQVFVLLTAMWASWMTVTELDSAYQVGISAMWFGGAVVIMSLVVGFLFATPFRKLGYVTGSGLIGERFGPTARTLAALVIGLTFPIFAMGNVLAAAAFLHLMTGWALWVDELVILLAITGYVSLAGMWTLAYTQAGNLGMMFVGLVVTVAWTLTRTGPLPHVPTLAGGVAPYALMGIGLGPILVWVLSDLVNVVSAQVEFQAVTAVRDPHAARRAVYLSSVALVPFMAAPVFLGLAARSLAPGALSGVLAFPVFLAQAPPLVRVMATLAVWSAALTWTAPLLFSGATSLGLDIRRSLRIGASAGQLRRLTRWALLVQIGAVIGYTALRPGDVAWWQVFGLTLRNGAVFAPTVAILLWPGATQRAAVSSMVLGVLSGLLWNAATGFSPTRFIWGVNPAWVGTVVAIVILVLVSLLEQGSRLAWRQTGQRLTGATLAVAVAALGAIGAWAAPLGASALLGPVALVGAVALLIGVSLGTELRSVEVKEPEATLVPVP